MAPHVSKSFDEVRPAGEGRQTLRSRTRPGPGVVSRLRDEDGRGEKRQRVDHECRIAAGERRHEAADRGADREHGRPQRARQRVAGQQLIGRRDVGNRRGSRRLEKCRRGDGQRRHDVGDPDLVGAPHEQQPQNEHTAHDICRDHHPTPIDPIDHNPAIGPTMASAGMHDQHPRHGGRRTGQIEQQCEDGHAVEPVAELRNHLADEQQPKIAVRAKEGSVGIHGHDDAARRLKEDVRLFSDRL